MGSSLKDYYKWNEKELNSQSKVNKLINKREMSYEKREFLKGVGNYEPVREAFEVFRITSEYDKEFAKFMGLSVEEVIKLIVQSNKVGEVLQMIEEEKRDVIKAYQIAKGEKSK